MAHSAPLQICVQDADYANKGKVGVCDEHDFDQLNFNKWRKYKDIFCLAVLLSIFVADGMPLAL